MFIPNIEASKNTCYTYCAGEGWLPPQTHPYYETEAGAADPGHASSEDGGGGAGRGGGGDPVPQSPDKKQAKDDAKSNEPGKEDEKSTQPENKSPKKPKDQADDQQAKDSAKSNQPDDTSNPADNNAQTSPTPQKDPAAVQPPSQTDATQPSQSDTTTQRTDEAPNAILAFWQQHMIGIVIGLIAIVLLLMLLSRRR